MARCSDPTLLNWTSILQMNNANAISIVSEISESCRRRRSYRRMTGSAKVCAAAAAIGMFIMTTLMHTCSAQGSAPAIIVFGDSTVDTGNNNFINTTARANFAPYGRDYPGRVPTGRFSDGKVPCDFFASALGIKDAVPPYLDPRLTAQDLRTGVSFASAASGYDDITAESASALNFPQQIQYFREYQSRLRGIAGPAEAQRIVSNAIYIISSGNADLGVSYFFNPFTRGGGRRSFQFTLDNYINFVIRRATESITQIYNLGARKFLVASLSILGCTPIQRTYLAVAGRPCNQRINAAALTLNQRFEVALANLMTSLQGSNIVFSNNYDILVDAVANPGRYGFVEVSRGCCGVGLVEVGTACEAARITCPDANRFVYWDSVHPSQRMYQIISDLVIRRDLQRLR